MRTTDFEFELPPERIAQEPTTPRDAARLLVRRGPADFDHARVRDLPRFLAAGDLLVVNDTRVLPARVLGHRATGGAVELLFLEQLASTERAWRAMVRPAKKLKPGEIVACADSVIARMVARDETDGTWAVELQAGPERDDLSGATVEELLAVAGAMPLPPYIDRGATAEDEERYQTVYARVPGAIAAPTAGLHFTDELFAALDGAGVHVARVTLHVGAGTFLPVTADAIEDHHMHTERFELSAETAEAVRACRARGGRVIAIGTTSARVLESCASADPTFERAVVEARSGTTDIFLHPGNRPRVCDGLFTNFHLPKSTLLMLVASLIGRESLLDLYRVAIEEEYRFYSYGDATLLLPSANLKPTNAGVVGPVPAP